jgi:ABC-type sugar transport system ATPase subunit
MVDKLVRMEQINKFFGRVQALNDVTLSVRRNEIVGLLDDNGAGKSTLIKILSGALRANSGEIYVGGNKVDIRNTTDAIALGIETIYQDSALVAQLSIARNFSALVAQRSMRWNRVKVVAHKQTDFQYCFDSSFLNCMSLTIDPSTAQQCRPVVRRSLRL